VVDHDNVVLQVPWPEVLDHLAEMQTAADSFDARCKKLPKKLKEWEAFLVSYGGYDLVRYRYTWPDQRTKGARTPLTGASQMT
jgi:hypothetical protein